MHELAEFGAAPLITVNYGQTSLGPPVAAAWVHKARTFDNYSDKTALWVVGNEGYGPWELDEHPNPHTPQSYATHALAYFEAVHRADPHAHVGFPVSISREVSAGTGTWKSTVANWL